MTRFESARLGRLGLTSVLLALLLAGGCGDPTGGPQAVSGKVTLKGAPLDDGVIEFLPQGDSSAADPPTKAPGRTALIKAGQYQVPKDRGLMPGRYKVVLSAGEKVAKELPLRADPRSMKLPLPKERIPAQYNVKSNEFVEVTKEGPNQFDYAIP